ncbi:MAG: aldo/keto reductase [Rikenellaceae bacterium]|jgi:predicted aldo/keto reductase-like oxidoreductase|nr:aldo/keto reductase [Rikenellaceae bacterium]
MDEGKKDIGRRDFLRALGAGAVVSTAALYGCKPRRSVEGGVTTAGEAPTDKMTYRTNPHSGDRVSLLGYGCMRWPMKPKADGSGNEIDQEATNELVDYAIAHGVNYFDVAPPYIQGLAEQATGIALKRHPREKFFIATKLSNMADNPRIRSFEGSRAIYMQSFKSLQVDHIDYYLLHSLGTLQGVMERFIDNGMLDFLMREREAGRIRNLGFSFHGDIEAFDYLLARDMQWDFVQIQLNYVDWKHASIGRNFNADYLYSELVKRNIPAVIMEPLLGGRLSKLPEHLLARLKEARPQDSAAAWAFRYAGTPENVLTVLSGMTYMEHLQENIRIYSPLEPLTDAERALLEGEVAELYARYPMVNCTTCNYCMPCPYGIDIPSVFAHYNRCVNEGNVSKSSQDENYRRARRAFLVGYDRSVPALRQANHCIACDICVSRCPQRVRIPQEMSRIDKFVEQLKQGLEF